MTVKAITRFNWSWFIWFSHWLLEMVSNNKQNNRKCTNAENICLKKYVIANYSIMDPGAQENQHIFLFLNVVKCNLT